jgi:hypothetical protein
VGVTSSSRLLLNLHERFVLRFRLAGGHETSLFKQYSLQGQQWSEVNDLLEGNSSTDHHTTQAIAVYLTTRAINATSRSSDQRRLIQSSSVKVVIMSTEATGEAYEEEHVHTVYEQIASHFSSTRYKVRMISTSYRTIP